MPLRGEQIKLGLRLALGGPKRAWEPMCKTGSRVAWDRVAIRTLVEALQSLRLAYRVLFDVVLETCSVYE